MESDDVAVPVAPVRTGPVSPVHGGRIAVPVTTETSSYAAFYAANRLDVLALAWSLLGDRSAAEELAQDAFVEAFRAWDRIGRYERPDAWVRRVVANRAVSRFRRRRSESGALTRLRAERPRVVQAPALPDDDERFWREVRALPSRQAQCVALHYLEDRPVAEIADILGINASTVKVHLHRGRLALADRLDLNGGER